MAEEVDPIKKSSELIPKTLPAVEETLIDADKTGTKLGSVPADATVDKQADVTQAITAGEGVKVPDVTKPDKPEEGIGLVDKTTDVKDIGKSDVAIGEVSKEIGDIQGEISEGGIAKPATQELDEKGTVKYQMANLMSDIEEGKPLPAWASPAVRQVQSIMQSRGMGASSMASAAMVQAVMESGMPIAAADAQAYSRIQLQNLTNEQQTALQNASTIAGMDMANLNSRMTAAVNNAKNFLSMDTANLSSEQQANTITYNAKAQAALTDAAADNARKQFNAKNELQIEEFFSELGSQIDSANANRNAAMEQFNVDQGNSIATYNQSMRDSRERFNATAKFAIDQSNVTWRRDVNTANTATQNETNRINVQNEYNASMSALNNLWQMYRDNATFNFQKIESGIDRQHSTALMGMEIAYNNDVLDQQEKMDWIDAVARFVGNLMK